MKGFEEGLMRVLSPGELAGEIYLMLRCLDLMKQIMNTHLQHSATPLYFMLKNWTVDSK